MITRDMSWQYSPYAPKLPPPLCFTVPAGNPAAGSHMQVAGGGIKVQTRQPKLMMDPSDRSTWQRSYRFTGAAPFAQNEASLRGGINPRELRPVFLPQ
jgi:hypothetical protein